MLNVLDQMLIQFLTGPMLKVRQQTDCLFESSHKKIVTQPQSTKQSASSSFRTHFAHISGLPRFTIVTFFRATGRTGCASDVSKYVPSFHPQARHSC